ncbi:protodermal factor 1 [Alnus glutinosa]|uniref:protodermal factor 1 n=1 Tax=Alnus glutinosa TaxID=3517 RepID=UPI002D78B268|nr:protodermal factor 1 [Alnus glutinosa]
MERVTSKLGPLYVWTVVAALLSQNVMIHVMSTAIEDQKNYYSPEPHPPRGSHRPPSHGRSGYSPTPSTPPGGYGVTPPSHHGGSGGYNPTPSTPSGGYGGPAPSDHGGSGGYYPTPSTPSGGYGGPTPSHHGGSGGYNPTPSPTSGGNCGTPPHEPTPSPSVPSPPSEGGYYNSPPTYPGGSPPTPVIVSPPTTPSIPSPPFFVDPNSPGTCYYWKTHPAVIWGVLGWWGTLGSTFGVTSVPGFGGSLTLQQALSNTRTDGLGALYREGTASLLNSMVNQKFPFTTKQVRESFVAALSSNKAAAAQAQLFKLANEGRVKSRP